MNDIRVTEHLSIPESELEVLYARSSGPGGQNVNKVNSKAVLRWKLVDNVSIAAPILERLKIQARHRISEQGILQISSQVHREQAANLRECIRILQRLVLAAMSVPKARKATRPTYGSQRRRLDEKARKGETKNSRSSVRWD